MKQFDKESVLNSVLYPEHYVSASKGNIGIVSNAAAGVAPGTVLSTAPPITLHNPASSGVNLAIIRTSMGYVSGTLGAGTIVYAYAAQPAAPTGGTGLTELSGLIGGTAPVGTAYTGSTIAATAAIIRPAFILGASLASTAYPPDKLVDEVNGSIVIPSGYVFCMEGIAAAGTSPLVILSITWEVIPA
jgi:hypothetical protein